MNDKINEIKNKVIEWHESPNKVIISLIVFFPLGLYFMWKNNIWTKRVRWIVTILIAVFVLTPSEDTKEVKKVKTNTQYTPEYAGYCSYVYCGKPILKSLRVDYMGNQMFCSEIYGNQCLMKHRLGYVE